MAVYTKFNQDKIQKILLNYNLGKLENFRGIEEGMRKYKLFFY